MDEYFHDPTFVCGKGLKHIQEDDYTGYHIYFRRLSMVLMLTTLLYVVRISMRPS